MTKTSHANAEFTVQDAAKLIGVGSKTLFECLRDEKVFNKDNVPYQNYIDREYFVVHRRERKDNYNNIIIYPRTYVTQKGIDWLDHIFNIDNHGSLYDIRCSLLSTRNALLNTASQLIIHEKKPEADKLRKMVEELNQLYDLMPEKNPVYQPK